MNRTTDLVARYMTDESGATAVEYGLIAALIGIGAIVGMGAFATNTDSAWNNLSDNVSNTVD